MEKSKEEKIAQAIELMIESSLRASFKENGIERTEDMFRATYKENEKCLSAFQKIYDKLIGKKNKGGV